VNLQRAKRASKRASRYGSYGSAADDARSAPAAGEATVDELYFPTKGWAGLTVRTFDLEKRQWSIYWISSASGRMDVPARRPGEDLRARTAEALKPS